MFKPKTQVSLYPTAIVAALAVSLVVVVATLVEAVAGMQSFI
jgi:hypothetical protein